MSLQNLPDGPYVTISYDSQNEWIYADWHGNHNLASVQQGCREMLRLMVEHGSSKVLNDNTYVTSTWSEAAEWGGTEWFPAMTAAGLKFFAWIYSPNVYSRLSTDLTLQFMSGTPIVGTFDDIATAREWLKQS